MLYPDFVNLVQRLRDARRLRMELEKLAESTAATVNVRTVAYHTTCTLHHINIISHTQRFEFIIPQQSHYSDSSIMILDGDSGFVVL